MNVEERNTDIDMIDHADEHKLIWKIVEDNHDNDNSITMMHIFTVKVQVINKNSMIYEKRIKMIQFLAVSDNDSCKTYGSMDEYEDKCEVLNNY